TATIGDKVTVNASCGNADHMWVGVYEVNPDGTEGSEVWEYTGKGSNISATIDTLQLLKPGKKYAIHVDARNVPGTSGGDVKSGKCYLTVLDVPYNAKIISNTIPTTMEAGKTYQVSVTVQNTGENAWTAADGYKLGGVGDSDPFALARQTLAAGETIAKGQTKTFTFNMIAPKTAGTYTTDWRMLREGVTWFGDTLSVPVTVVDDPLRNGLIAFGLDPDKIFTLNGTSYTYYQLIKERPTLQRNSGNSNDTDKNKLSVSLLLDIFDAMGLDTKIGDNDCYYGNRARGAQLALTQIAIPDVLPIGDAYGMDSATWAYLDKIIEVYGNSDAKSAFVTEYTNAYKVKYEEFIKSEMGISVDTTKTASNSITWNVDIPNYTTDAVKPVLDVYDSSGKLIKEQYVTSDGPVTITGLTPGTGYKARITYDSISEETEVVETLPLDPRIQEIKQNLFALNSNTFKDVFNDYENAVKIFLNDYFDGEERLKDAYDRILNNDEKLDALLGWTREAIKPDSSITYGPGILLPGEVYLQDIVNQTPGASLIGTNTVAYCDVQSTFQGRLLKGKWVVNEQEFLNWKTEVLMSGVAANAFDHQIVEIDKEQNYTERSNWRYEVDMRKRIISDQSLQEARDILIGISFDVITAGGSTAAEVIKELVKSIAMNALILLGHETEATLLGLPKEPGDIAPWTISTILEFLDIGGIINADEVKNLSIAMAKQRVTETLVLGYLAARLKRDIFVERLTSLRDFAQTQLTREGINNENNINLTEEEFQVFKKYLVKNYDYVIQMNQEDVWNELTTKLYRDVFTFIDGLFE
ncbi:MAG TPA: NBR1-Ig-like domain-containing protein, partial [Mobilitalea sp.]|nr:NBR1-Ig-like domain-containing protein [Mobilitalea sp.]